MSDKNFMAYGDAETILSEVGAELGKRIIQMSTMPTASVDYLNTIVQYVGTSNNTYVNGFFYKCVYDNENDSYSWENISVQAGDGTGFSFTGTLLANGWTNHQQTLTFAGYSASLNGVIGIPTTATSAQKAAYTDALIDVVSQSGNNFTFAAENDPVIDLPVVLYAGGASSAGASSLVDLTDVNVSSPADGEVLKYNSSTQKWENGTGGSGVTPNPAGTATADLEKIEIDGTVYDVTDADAIHSADKGANNGVAELDSNGKVPSAQLPSFVDDVVEGYYDSTTDRFYEESTFETVIPPTDGKSWVDVTANKSYRWTGSVYVRVDEGVQLGETSSTAYRGDRGKTAYDHATDANKISSAVTSGFYKFGATADGHIASMTAVTKSDITALGIADNLDDLSDIELNNPINNEVLKYNSTTQKWENGVGSTVGSLNDLSDVDLSSLLNSEMLVYDGTNQEWKNKKVLYPISEAEWNTLTPAQKENGTMYLRYEADSNFPPIQNDDSATQFIAQSVPTGQTIDSVISSNLPIIGSNQNGNYFKFSSGLLICTKTVTASVTYTAWGTWYESNSIDLGNFALSFNEMPTVTASLNNSGQAAIMGGVQLSKTGAGTAKVYRPNNIGGSVSIGIIAVGTWK